MAKKKCNHCGLEKDEEEFNWRYEAFGQSNKTYRDCQHGFKKTYYGGDARQRHVPCQGMWDKLGNRNKVEFLGRIIFHWVGTIRIN